MHIVFTGQNGTGIEQLTGHGGVFCRGFSLECPGATGGRQACGVDVVLESDGDTGKQLGRIPACTRGICCDCLFEHLPGIARNKGIERNRIWLTAQEFSDIFSGGKSALNHVSPGFNDG